jgi:hypothetical protein
MIDRPGPRSVERRRGDGDDGSVLVLVLLFIILAAVLVVPMLNYAMAVTMASKVSDSKASRVEAVKAGLRTALSNPSALYKQCEGAGLNSSWPLASPGVSIPVNSKCYLVDSNYSEDATKRPYGVTSTQAGAPLPTFFTVPARADVYPFSGDTDANKWRTFLNDERTQNTIWAPNLPAHALTARLSASFAMPSGYPACKVFFPGTYKDPLIINSSTPVYFASGIYYFENTVTISGGANVVVGGGANEGCTSDQEAAFYAENAPETHNITGLGATFVFGAAGQLVVNQATAGPISLVFNQRYVADSDLNNLPSASVSITSVNGEMSGPLLVDLIRAGVISVPASLAPTVDGTFNLANLTGYLPSTLVPPDPAIIPAPADTSPIIDIGFTSTEAAKIEVPGYVSVPQGRFRLDIPLLSSAQTAKTINFSGGLVARKIEIPGKNPATFSIGVAEVVVQLVLRIHSETASGSPMIVGEAIVQVNKNGGYAVNTWVVQ